MLGALRHPSTKVLVSGTSTLALGGLWAVAVAGKALSIATCRADGSAVRIGLSSGAQSRGGNANAGTAAAIRYYREPFGGTLGAMQGASDQ